MKLADTIAALEKQFPGLEKKEFRDETTLTVDRLRIAEICTCAKNQLGFDMLMDIASVDNFGNEPRFEVVYLLHSLTDNHYLRLKCAVSEDDLTVPTVSGVWQGANWLEREVYDMMGIRFTGHPDLRRILMWEGYPYYPMRKDFPLSGRVSDMPDVAFTKAAPLEGGPFVTTPGPGGSKEHEPRSKRMV